MLGDWDNPYKTMDFANEAGEIRALAEMVKHGFVFKGLKPVNWCFDCGSALAEAEVEYADKKSQTIDVAFNVADEARLAQALKDAGLVAEDAPVFVQCFEVEPLKTFKTLSKARRVQLVGAQTPGMVDAEGLKQIASYAHGVGPDWSLVIPTAGGALGAPTPLVSQARALGLEVHPWTVRAENRFLPAMLRSAGDLAAHGDAGAVLKALYAAGVTGVFSDFPGLAVRARG